eukprot:Lankesteria_metandrocarpae@DN5316_c2_g1_i1.p1
MCNLVGPLAHSQETLNSIDDILEELKHDSFQSRSGVLLLADDLNKSVSSYCYTKIAGDPATYRFEKFECTLALKSNSKILRFRAVLRHQSHSVNLILGELIRVPLRQHGRDGLCWGFVMYSTGLDKTRLNPDAIKEVLLEFPDKQ